jgi:hypothetical protein
MSVLYIQVYIYLQMIGHYPAFVSSYYYSERDRLESGNLTVRFVLRFQPVDATHWLNRSAGVSKFNVFRGHSFSLRATALSCA